jgi:hypothetical protein
MAVLDDVKLALRVTTNAFDSELLDLIVAAQNDLGVAGVTETTTDDPLVKRAVVTYCRVHFGTPDDYERMKRSYDEQKAQLSTHTGHTDWLMGADEDG